MNRNVVTLLASLLVLPACTCTPPPAPPPSPPAAQDGRPSVVVLRRTGGVELQRGDGAWATAKLGDRIGESDGLRTRGDGEADIVVDGVRVRLHDRSELHVGKVSATSLLARVRGHVESDVIPGKGAVALQVDGSDAEANSEGGHFYVMADGRGVVTVGAVEGAVRLSSRGKAVELRRGEVSRVQPEGGPEQPTKALEKVLLAVEWPEERTNRPSVPLRGRVAAGSRVFVQGNFVEVAPSGEFQVDVKLHDGRQSIAVVTVDPLGRRKEDSTEVVRDASPPDVRISQPPWRR